MYSRQIEEIIAQIKRGYAAKYDRVVIEATPVLNQRRQELVLRGRVLLSSQRDRIVNALGKRIPFKIIDRLLILSDPTQPALNWGKAGQEIVGLRRQRDSFELSTQTTPEDNPFRVLIKDGRQYLIQLDDLSLGWVYEDEIVILEPPWEDLWKEIKRPEKGKLIKIEPKDLSKLANTALKYVRITPYHRGGRSRQGLDCSGLIQVIFKEALDLVLPKHALDQMKMGQRLSRLERQTGDLIFAKVIGRNIVHVGLLLVNQKKKVVHSCLRKGQVVAEALEDFLKNYKPVGYRRYLFTSPEGKDD
ncbi:MAG: NlpC/P60 family protein [bacterium]